MQFNKNTSIYLQIADYMYDRILGGDWPDGERIPSIRDMAIQLEVNPNTVTRTYTLLQEEGTLENQRGIGYFTANDARANVLARMRENFLRDELPGLFARIEQLGLTITDIETQHARYVQEKQQS